MADERQTHERTFTLDVPILESDELLVRVPRAPGFEYPDPETAAFDNAAAATEKKRRKFSERYDALEGALRQIADLLPYFDERELLTGFDCVGGYQYLHLLYQGDPFSEYVFKHDGTVIRNNSDSKVEEIYSSWLQGFKGLLQQLRTEADLEMQAAAARLEALRAFKIKGT